MILSLMVYFGHNKDEKKNNIAEYAGVFAG